MKQNNKTNKGFTLVELIIVVAIIAVLAAVLAPQYLQYVERSRQSNDLQIATNLVKAATIAAADPKSNIVPGTIIEVAWITSNDRPTYENWILVRDAGHPSSGQRTSALIDYSTYEAKMIGLDAIGDIQKGVLGIMGVEVLDNGSEYYGIMDGSLSAVAKSNNFVFHLDTGTGQVAVAYKAGTDGVKNAWVDEIGVNLIPHP